MSDDELKRLLEDFLSEEEARGDSGAVSAPAPGAERFRLADFPMAHALRRITAARDVDQVLAAVLSYANELDLDRCLIALLEEPGVPPDQRQVEVRAVWDRARKEAAFLGDRFSPLEIPLVGQMGPEDQVVVDDVVTSSLIDEQTRATLQYLHVGAAAILPLAVGGQLLGWLLAETVDRARPFARQEVDALQSIADQASVALENLGLLEETRARAIQLQAAAEISSAASSLLAVDELLELAVELIRERFGLYYVGIFMLEGDAAVLRAGTGEAGRQMMAENYRLAVGDAASLSDSEYSSMIGWCVANSRARIALDVGQDAVHFDNPLLPETRSEMALPLNSRGRVVGAMTIQSVQPAAFDDSDVAVLQIMADQLANAIENARLFQERERRITELAIVNEIGAALASLTLDVLSLDTLFEIVHRQVSRLFNADSFYIATYQEGSEHWTSAFHLEGGERQPEARYSIATGLTGHIIRTRQPVLFGMVEENARFQESQGVTILGELAHSWLGVPLVTSEKLVGVMAIQDYTQEHLYGESDLALFATIGAQVAGALDNVRLLEEARRRARETELINEVGQAIASVLDLDEVLRQIVDVTKERFGHYFVSIALLEGEQLIFRQGSTIGHSDRRLGQSTVGQEDEQAGKVLTVDLTQVESLIGEAARSRQPVLVGDVLLDPRYMALEELPETRSELTVPIEVKGRVIGTLDVQSDRPYAYEQIDLVLVQLLARQAGIAIENARLFGETRRQAEEFAVLHQSSLEMTQEQQELDTVLATASRRMMELLDSDGGGVWLWQEADQELELVLNYQVGDAAEAYTGKRLKPGEGLSGRAFAERRILVVDDYLAWNGMASSFQDAPFVAALAVPMMWRGEAVGVLVATRSQPGRSYSAGEQNLAELLAGQAAAAIQNARLFGDAQGRAEQLAVANEVGQAVISVLDVDAVLRQIVDTIKERLGYFFVGILLLEGKELVFRSGSLIGDSDIRWRAGELRLDLDGGPEGSGLTVAVVNRGEPILVNDVSQDSRYGTVEGLEPVRAELDTPIRVKGQVIGVLTVQSDRVGAFDRSDQHLLESLASQAGVAIENARLFAETEDALTEMEALYNTSRLLASARDLQQVLAAVAEGMYVAAINRAVLWEVEAGPGADRRDSEPGAALVAANWYSGEGTEPLPVGTRFPLDTFPAARVILAPSEIFVEDVEKDERLDAATRAALVAQNARALAILPLWVGRRQIGVLMLVAERPYRFTPREMRPYRSLAGQMAVVIENRQLFEQTEMQLTSLARIQTALAELNAAVIFDKAIDALLPQVAAIGQADRVRMYMIDGDDMTCVGTHSDTGPDRVLAGDTVSLHDYPLTKHVVATGQPMSIMADDPRLQPHARKEYAAAGLAANATIPLIGREGVVGVLSLNRNHPALPFGEQELGLVQTLANQATTVLEKNQLFEETQRRTTELQSLYETSLRMSTHLETTELLTFIVEQAMSLLGAEAAGFYLYDPTSDELVFSVAVGYLADFVGQRLKPGEGLSGTVFQERRAITVEDYQAWSGRATVYEQEERLGMLLGVPLLSRDTVLGVLDIAAGKTKGAFEARDLWMAELFAAQAATALENAGLFEQIQTRAEEQATLRRVTETVSRALDMQYLLDASLEQTMEALGFDAGLISLYEREGLVLSAQRGLPEPMARVLEQDGFDGTLCAYVLATGETITIGDIRAGAPADVEGVIRNGLLAYAGAPLSARGERVGTLCLFHRAVRKVEPDEQDLLEAIGAQIGLGIGNVRLFEETQARAEELAVLNEMARALTAQLDVREVLSSIYRYLSRLLDTTNFYVALYDAAADEISFPFVVEAGKEIRWNSRRSGRGLTEYVMRTAEPMLIEEEVSAHISVLAQREEVEQIGNEAESWLGVPLLLGAQALGIVAVQSYDTRSLYTEHDRDLLVAAASQAAIAIQNARLFEEEQRARALLGFRINELDCLNDIGRTIDEAPAVADLLAWVADRIPAAMQFPDRAVAAIEFEGQICGDAQALELPAQIVQALYIGSSPAPVGRVCIAYRETEAREDSPEAIPGAELAFLDEESALLGDITRRVAGYLENRRLFRQAEARAAELAVLNELGQVLPTRLDVDSVLFEGYRAASRLLEASDFYVTIYEAAQEGQGQITFPLIVEDGQLARPYRRRPADRRGLTEYLVQTRQPLLIRSGMGQRLEELGVESISLGSGRQALCWLGVPLTIGDRVLGTMVALSFAHSDLYDEHDLELLVAIANRVAVALENVNLLQRAQARAEQERLVRTITDRVRRGVDRQAIMRVALREISDMLGASSAVVRLGTVDAFQAPLAQGAGRPTTIGRPGITGLEDGPQDGDTHTSDTKEGG